MRHPRVCRLCRQEGPGLIKYSTRSYAHGGCYIKRHGLTDLLSKVPTWELRQMSVSGMSSDEIFSVVATIEKREAAAEVADG